MTVNLRQIDLGFGAITIDKNKWARELNKLLDEDCADDHIFGVWVPADSKIYLARESNESVKWQTLVHEIAEAMISYMEIPYSHDKVLLLETMLSNLLKNKSLILGYWRSQDAAHR